jgi:hypothetical protein
MTERKDLTRVRLQKGLTIVKRGSRWYAEKCVHGVQRKWSLGTRDAEEAARKAFLEASQERPRPPFPKPTPKSETLTLRKALDYGQELQVERSHWKNEELRVRSGHGCLHLFPAEPGHGSR